MAPKYDDCTEPESNGEGCLPLSMLSKDVARIEVRQGEQDAREGRFLAAVGEAKRAALEAKDASVKALASCARIEEKLYGPVNDVIASYVSAPPPDFDDGAGDVTKTQDVRALRRRAKTAERTRIYLALIGAATTIATALTTYLATRH